MWPFQISINWSARYIAVSVLLLLFLTSGIEAVPRKPNCLPDRVLGTGESVEISTPKAWGTVTVAVEVAGAGELMVEVAGQGGARAWVELLPNSCVGSLDSANHAVIRERSFSRQRLGVFGPGVYPFRIGLVDPDQGAGTVYFSSGLSMPEIFPRDSEDGDETEEIDVQIQPFQSRTTVFSPRDGEDGDETEEIDVQIQPLQVVEPRTGCIEGTGELSWSEDLVASNCSGEPANDLIWCARPVRGPGGISGELDTELGIDHDYFTFRLSESSIVRFFTTGSADTAGTLFDAQGQPLQFADEGGGDENFSLVAFLPAGVYFLRVDGAFGTTGKYTLRFEHVESP